MPLRHYGTLAVLFFAGCTPSAPATPNCAQGTVAKEPPGPIHHVLLVTVDGLLPDSYLHPDAHGLAVPTLRRLVREGATSDGALSVFPTVTYPSHTSMVTGVNPGKHGIMSNLAFDPLETDLDGWRWYAEDIKRDPVWRLSQRAGYETAIVHWPVTVGAGVTWLVPEYWRAKDEQDKKLLRAMSTPGLLDAVARTHPDFWSRYTPPNVHDDALTDIATHLLETAKPTLLLLHLVEVDGAQHHHGVWSPEAVQAIENDDRQLTRIFDVLTKTGLSKDTSVVVASDHGFMNTSAMVKPGVLLREAGLVTLKENHVVDWKAAVLNSSGQAYVYVRSPTDTATRDQVRALLDQKAHVEGSGIGRVYSQAEIVALGGDPDAFLALEATPGFQFGAGVVGDYTAPPVYHGTHGYDPNRPELHASLILVGPNVPHGTLTNAKLVDIGPTIANWLGLSMPNTDGAPLQVTPAH